MPAGAGGPAQKLTGAKPYACERQGRRTSPGHVQQHQRPCTRVSGPTGAPLGDATHTWSSDHRCDIRTHTARNPTRARTAGRPSCAPRTQTPAQHAQQTTSPSRAPRVRPDLQQATVAAAPTSARTWARSPSAAPPATGSSPRASRMMEHRRAAPGERGPSLPHLRKCFTKSSNLLEHQTLHTGQRPLQVRRSRRGLRAALFFGATSAHPHRRAALPLRAVWPGLRAPPP